MRGFPDDLNCYGDVKSNNNVHNQTVLRFVAPIIDIFLFILVCQEYGVNK
jgi:hypothetical protein